LRLLANATAAPAEESQKPQRTKDQRQVIAGNAPPARSTIEVLFLFGSHGENIFFSTNKSVSRSHHGTVFYSGCSSGALRCACLETKVNVPVGLVEKC